MEIIRIPKQRWNSFVTIGEMSNEDVETLFASLSAIPAAKYGPELADQLSETLSRSGLNDYGEIVDTLISLFPLIISKNKPIKDVIDELALAATQTPPFADKVKAINIERLRVNLQKLLHVPSMGLGAKAMGVLFDNPHNFMDARVITDMRPVFEIDDLRIGGAVILHTMKLEYSIDGNGEKEFFVTMDSDDIRSLISKLDRALEKADKLAALMAASSVSILNPVQS